MEVVIDYIVKMSRLRPHTRSLALAVPFLFLFLLNATAISQYSAEAFEKNERWNYVASDVDVELVHEIISGYRTGLNAEQELRLAEVIVGQSNAYSLDPYFVLALIKKESTFKNFVRSKSGAYGLMQITPNTGRAIAKELGIEWKGTKKTLYDPLINVRLGVHYLSSILDRFNGDKRLALAAYNHGPARLSWRIRTGRHTNFKFVDKIYSDYEGFKLDASLDTRLVAAYN